MSHEGESHAFIKLLFFPSPMNSRQFGQDNPNIARYEAKNVQMFTQGN